MIDSASFDNFDGFALRAFIAPKSGMKACLSLILYPLNTSELIQEFSCCQDPQFPGILIKKEDIMLGISSTLLGQPACGTPILPLIKGGCQLSPEYRPPTEEIIRGLFALLNTVTVGPEIKTSLKSARDRWTAIEDGTSVLKGVSIEWKWPDPPSVTPTTGINCYHRSGIEGASSGQKGRGNKKVIRGKLIGSFCFCSLFLISCIQP